MPNHEQATKQVVISAFEPQAINSNATTTGAIIDTVGYSKGVYFAMGVNARTTGTFTMKIEHGDDASLSDAADVPSANLVYGTLPALSAAITEGGDYAKEAVFGTKRYVRMSVVSTSVVTTGATVAAVAVLGADLAPTDQS